MLRYALLMIILPWAMTSASEFIDIARNLPDKHINGKSAHGPVNVSIEVPDSDQSIAPGTDRGEGVTWSENHQNLIRIELKGDTGNGFSLLPFVHLNEMPGDEHFDPESLQKSSSRNSGIIERLTPKSEFSRSSQKSPTSDLVSEALDYGYIKLSRAPERLPVEKSPKNRAMKFEEKLRGKKMFSKEDEPQIMEFAAHFLKERLGTLPTQIPEEIILQAVNQSTHLKSRPSCQTQTDINCKKLRYQSFDGYCNNLRNPLWGAVDTCQVRLLPAFYEDGISKMRSTSVNGKSLPSGLFIAKRIFCEDEEDSKKFNMWSISVGQLLSHDLGRSPLNQRDCCSNPSRSECLNFFADPTVKLPPEASCISIARTESCAQCKIGPRNVINVVTSLIDLSPLYGSDIQTANSLRLRKGGLMKFNRDDKGGMILPKSEFGEVNCAEFPTCVNAGDTRAVQNPEILLAQNTVLRFHNRIAKMLSELYPNWSDETLFQSTRKVVIMHWQRIVYEEYLPLVLGKEYYFHYELGELRTNYSPKFNPSGIVEVLVAAFRFGHTMIKSYSKLKKELRGEKALRLKPNFFNPNSLFEGQVNSLSDGLLHQPSARGGVCLATDVTDFLYWTTVRDYTDYGFNLAAANIERGRDHGVAPYPTYVQFCFGIKIDSWKDLESIMSPKNIARLQLVYKSVWDVDLWVGGLYELRIKNGMIGPTFGCLLGIQFYNLKYGDRFFYTHYEKQRWYPAGLNIGQYLASPLHNLICLASGADRVLERPMEIESKENQPKSCDYLQYQKAKGFLTSP